MASGLKKLPSEVGEMTLPEALEIFEYWRSTPPEAEILAILAQVYTTWTPDNAHPRSAEEQQDSLEARWKAGAMNVKQLFEATGGAPVRLEI